MKTHHLLLLLWLGTGTAVAQSPTAEKAAFNPPDEATIPADPYGDAIRLGQKVLSQTSLVLKNYLNSTLNCTSCHLNGGRQPNAAPWVGIWGVFPEYRTRNARIYSLQDRINDCFERSMNGKALPYDSKEMLGMLAYMHWLSKDVPTGMDVEGRGFIKITAPQEPDAKRGEKVYAEKCAACHQADGQGQYGPNGETIFPALWGDKSFNIGASMARLNTAAAFTKANMPLGQGYTLTDQEAFDVALYFTRQPRPDFAEKSLDWPEGDKPEDARY